MDYADQTYWDNRYMSKSESERTYEWYLSFDTVYKYIAEDLNSAKLKRESRFLVAGCGNSTLCEDLYNQGGDQLQLHC